MKIAIGIVLNVTIKTPVAFLIFNQLNKLNKSFKKQGDVQTMYQLKFTKLPKTVKKHLKTNKQWKKVYALDEADLLFSNAILTTKATGDVVLSILCPTGEPRYEFKITIDATQSLSQQVLADFEQFLNKEQSSLEALYHDPIKNKEQIKELEDDLLILTNRAKEIKNAFAGFEDKELADESNTNHPLQEVPQVMEAVVEEIMVEEDVFADIKEFEDDIFEDDVNRELPPEPKSTNAPAPNNHPEPSQKAKSDEQKLAVFDPSTMSMMQALEGRIIKIDEQIKKGIEHYIFDEFYLTTATDFASKEKKELIKSKYLAQANQTFKSMRDWAKTSLEELKQQITNEIKIKHDELNAQKETVRERRKDSMAQMLKVSLDKKKGELKKEIIAKCDAEIAQMEIELDNEQRQKLAIEVDKIEESLAKGFSDKHKQELEAHHAKVSQLAQEKIDVVFETIDQGYSGLLAEIKANLNEHEKDINTRYQLYKDDKAEQLAKDVSNQELQLRMRQIEMEEKKLSQSNETRLLSEQVEQLKITLEKNRLEDQMKLMAKDKEEQAKEMRKLKRLVGVSFVLMTLTIAGVVVFLM